MLVAVLWGRGWEGPVVPASLSARFQSLPPLPTIKLGPSGADSQVCGLVHALGPYASLQWTLLWGWEFLLLPPQLPQVCSVRGLRLYFSELDPWVALSVAGSASCCLALPAPQSTASLGPTATVLLWVLSTRLPVSAPPPVPPTGLDECFFFISLVVGLPYSSIFCQFWLFFVFKLLLRGGTVCLPTPPSWPEVQKN